MKKIINRQQHQVSSYGAYTVFVNSVSNIFFISIALATASALAV